MPKTAYMITADGFPDEYLTTDSDPSCYDTHRKATKADLTLTAIAEMLDQDAESCNAHDFVGCHKKLAAMLVNVVGKKDAVKVMVALIDYDGLHGLDGVAGSGNERLSAELDKVELL
jgi:hypothetical protein